ncbi:MAG: SPW repeat protein [Candidatus Andersenbacteria bacterium]
MAMTLEQARTSVRTTSGIDVVAGLWLIIAPFVLGYASVTGALWNDVIFGIAIVLLAGSREVGEGYRYAWPSWVAAAIGIWMIIAPFAIGYSFVTEALWNDVIIGIAVALLATWSALSTPRHSM